MTLGSLHVVFLKVAWVLKLNVLHELVVVDVLILSIVEQEARVDLLL